MYQSRIHDKLVSNSWGCRISRIWYLNPGGGCEDGVVRVFQTLLFLPLCLGADEQVEVCRQVASQQGFTGRNVEQKGERFHVKTRLQHLHKKKKTWRWATDTQAASLHETFLTISPPWTPLPLRLGAYSARSTERSHSITLWLVHWEISAGVMLFCTIKENSDGHFQKVWNQRSAGGVIPRLRVVSSDSWGHTSWGAGPGWLVWCWGDEERCKPSVTAGPPGEQHQTVENGKLFDIKGCIQSLKSSH